METLTLFEEHDLTACTTFGAPVECKTYFPAWDERVLVQALDEARKKDFPVALIGQGSNVIFCTDYFDGAVIRYMDDKQRLKLTATDDPEDSDYAFVNIFGGYLWDNAVLACVKMGLSGAEALSGIPGTAAAALVQNIGAYGCEIKDILHSAKVYDRKDGSINVFTPADFQFGYRTSIIKQSVTESDFMYYPTPRYIVLNITLRLKKASELVINDERLSKTFNIELGKRVKTMYFRKRILATRRKKGMIYDADDSDTHSTGSYFQNPIIERDKLEMLPRDIPVYETCSQDKVKISAAYLIENSGFKKGYAFQKSDAYISTRHALAIANYGHATYHDVLELQEIITNGVYNKFGVKLHPEVNLLKNRNDVLMRSNLRTFTSLSGVFPGDANGHFSLNSDFFDFINKRDV
ncbi:MAG: UDP-N-acetylmuramate dehydrogenase [Bifidobacteriaceae bacterium]|jgi:UDP-N-acetylmuramate dehydrogenase|nr:UDP-N-acetylmuramate dehydrogenase [Bifidobacteriaceae bacterium]